LQSRTAPLGLKNLGQNVCFFNSLVQALYSIKSLRERVCQFEINVSTPVKTMAINELFTSMTSSAVPIETYQLLPFFGIGGYDHSRFEQFDAQECLLHILEIIYPSNADNTVLDASIFKIAMLEELLCKSCKKISEKNMYDSICCIKFSNLYNNSIEKELLKLINAQNAELLDEPYVCSNCPIRTMALKSTTLLHVSDYLIISLGLFRFDQATNTCRKVIPEITIENRIDNILLGTLQLQAVIFHHGETANSGHYTSAVKYGEQWFSVDDAIVNPIHNPNFNCKVNDHIVPYLLIYKKSNVVTSFANHTCHFSNLQLNINQTKTNSPLISFPTKPTLTTTTPNELNNNRKNKADQILQKECDLYGITFLPPNENETTTAIRKRRKTMRDEIKHKKKCPENKKEDFHFKVCAEDEKKTVFKKQFPSLVNNSNIPPKSTSN